jgi:hypothetical protein
VSSTETTMIKNESPVFDFDHSSASSRINCHLVPCGPHFHTAQSPPLNVNPYPSFRNNSLSSYQFPVKQFYPLPNYGEFGEEHVDYGLQYSLATAPFQGDQMGIGTNCTPAPSRTWASTPPLKCMPFLDQPAPVYSHGQSSYNTTNFDARSNISPESKPPQLTTVPQTLSIPSLPTPINTGMDRLLPFPAPVPINRPAQFGPFFSSTDGLLARTHGQGSYVDYSSPQTLKSDSSSSNVSSNSNQSTPENGSMSTTIYTPVATQSPGSLNSAQTAYSSSPFSLPASQQQQQQQHVYTSPQSSYHGMLNTDEVSSSYGHSSSNNNTNNTSYERRGSHASHKGSTASTHGLLNTNEASGSYNHSSSNNNNNNNKNTSYERHGSQVSYKGSSASNHHGLLSANEASGSYDHSSSSNNSSNTSYERRSSYASHKALSVSSQGGYHPDGLPPVANGTLTNGYRYYPASSSNQYPAPPIDIQPQPRRASGVVA